MRARVFRATAALGAAVLLLTAACTSNECRGASCAAPRTTTSPTTSEWRRILDLRSEARQEVAAAVVGKIAYVVGGLVAGGGATDVVEAYEPPFWLEVPPLPIKIHHAMAAALDGKLVVLGGFVGELGGPATRRVFILDGRGGPWREGPPMRRARGAGAAVAVGAEIIVVGGISDGKHVGPIEIFDGTAWRDGTPIPSLRDHLGAATDGKLVYAAGGRRGGGHFATFDVYDPGADRWSSLPDMPTPRSGNGVTFAGGSVIAAGGEGPRIFPEAEAYDVATGRWRRLPNLAMPVHGVGLVTLGTDVYAFGGGIRVGLAPSRACQVLAIA